MRAAPEPKRARLEKRPARGTRKTSRLETLEEAGRSEKVKVESGQLLLTLKTLSGSRFFQPLHFFHVFLFIKLGSHSHKPFQDVFDLHFRATVHFPLSKTVD